MNCVTMGNYVLSCLNGTLNLYLKGNLKPIVSIDL